MTNTTTGMALYTYQKHIMIGALALWTAFAVTTGAGVFDLATNPDALNILSEAWNMDHGGQLTTALSATGAGVTLGGIGLVQLAFTVSQTVANLL